MQTADGEIPCVSRERMVEAYMDGEAMQAITGGIIEIRVARQRTDVPGEAVTTHGVLAWYESDAARIEEAEQHVVEQLDEETLDAPEPADEDLAAAVEATVADSPDGFDTSQLEEEDVSSLPESVR